MLCLCKFWEASWWVATAPEHLVRDALPSPSWQRFLNMHAGAHDDPGGADLHAPEEEDERLWAQVGGHLFCPFERSLCSFHQLKRRRPINGNKADDALLVCAWQANLDAFWSRWPGAADGVRSLLAQQARLGEVFEFEMFPPPS